MPVALVVLLSLLGLGALGTVVYAILVPRPPVDSGDAESTDPR